MSPSPALIADIGGTNARFALTVPGGGWRDERVLSVADFPGPAEAARAYLEAVRPAQAPRQAAFCIACPVMGDDIRMTNAPWAFSIDRTQAALGLDSLRVVNDFVANALACPHLAPDHVVQVGGGVPRSGAPIAALGPGTGLGVALLVPAPDGRLIPVATEGGHVTLAAADDRQAAILARLRRNWDHISAERLVSGTGLPLLHQAVAQEEGHALTATTPKAITAAALAGDAGAVATLNLFCAFLGNVAGNLALSSGAGGGVYVLGGIIPAILPFFTASPFRANFEAKGRFRDYLSAIPTSVVTHPYPAFLGLEGLTTQAVSAAAL